MPELSERDIKFRRTIPHPDYCRICCDDCWGVQNGLVSKNGKEYCETCEFCAKLICD